MSMETPAKGEGMQALDYEQLGCLHDMFRRQAALTPGTTAVVDGAGSMTYAELDDISDTLAAHLQALGLGTGRIVGIYLPHCLDFVISYIAILKAGGAYMPLDLSYPIPLLEDIVADSVPLAIIACPSYSQSLPQCAQNVIVASPGWLAGIAESLAGRRLEPVEVTLDDMVCTVYSSGTTGRPKGIRCPHRGAVFSYHWRHLEFPYEGLEREACNVFFVWEMLRPLLAGVTLHIIPDSTIYDPKLLCEFIDKNQITRMLMTPSLLETILDSNVPNIEDLLKSLKVLIFCGEVVTTKLLDRCLSVLKDVKLPNLYSVSEAHDIACIDLVEWAKTTKNWMKKHKYCSVGQLLPGVNVMVLDEEMELKPLGVSGEIFVSGQTLALGYLNRPELNAQRFIARPDSLPIRYGDRLYKTGDWGHMLSNRSFTICGRCDSMVKVRGYSIEVQAVEAALLELHNLVQAAVCIVAGEEGQNKSLIAYVVPNGLATKADIRAALKLRLPFFMIPSHFILLDRIPVLATSGKLDKKALPPFDLNNPKVNVAVTETEKMVSQFWAEVLSGNALVDVHESFFDAGGHSLSAALLLSKINAHFSTNLTVKDLFMNPTLCGMAKLIDHAHHHDLNELRAAMKIPEVDLQQEVQRYDLGLLQHMDIQLRAFWRSMDYVERWNSARVLITGATGFLGGFILRDLLNNTKTHIFCLVRHDPDKKGLDRVRSSLQQFGILASSEQSANSDQKRLEQQFLDRVTAMEGDVSLMNLGLSEEDSIYLSTQVDFIVHAAAYVNLVYPYRALQAANVLGTHNVLLFATLARIKPLVYISTNAVFPTRSPANFREDDSMTQYAAQLKDGYGQTKWVAEQLVLKAVERGLPAVIIRPGNLSGDTKGAHWNPNDFVLMMLRGCLTLGFAPDISWDIEMTPVDFVSSFVVVLCQKMQLGIGKCFHLVNPEPIKATWLYEWLCAHNFSLKVEKFSDWILRLQNEQNKEKSRELQKLQEFFAGDSECLENLGVFHQENVEKVLKILNLRYPVIDHNLLKTYFSTLSKKQLIPMGRRNTLSFRPLDGEVALVTGASSGIGAAIARSLGAAGARVVLAARREEKLDEVKSAITAEGGLAISVQCDVTKREEVEAMIGRVMLTFGKLTILVNNAGVMYYTLMDNCMLDQWLHMLDLNCKAVLHTIGLTLPIMLEQKHGHIINISSDVGRRGYPGLSVYCGTKFFIEGLSQGMRLELCKKGIKITSIQPGDTKSELLTHTTDEKARELYDGSNTCEILEAEDIAKAVLYAVQQPRHVAVNEIMIEPAENPC